MSDSLLVSKSRLGIDIGRVIIGGGDQPGADTVFLNGSDDRAMQTPAIPEAFASIASLYRAFDGRVWLVSKAGARIRDRTLRWFAAQQFYCATGLTPERVRFCRERAEKAEHAKVLGLTHFIDDRSDVLEALHGIVPNLILFGPQRRPIAHSDWFSTARDWAAVRRLWLTT